MSSIPDWMIIAWGVGVPCKHGHLAPRRTSNGNCSACQREAQAAWRAKQKREGRPVPDIIEAEPAPALDVTEYQRGAAVALRCLPVYQRNWQERGHRGIDLSTSALCPEWLRGFLETVAPNITMSEVIEAAAYWSQRVR